VEEEVKAHQDLLDDEDKVREKVDAQGNKWRKVYFGGGSHFQNWLDQTVELCGKRNVEVEEVNIAGLSCSSEGGEKMYRIWVKEAK
jgi:hypothetical protein